MSNPINADEIARRLTNVPPGSPDVHAALDELTAAGIMFGEAIARYVPAGREQALAATNLEQALAWAKKGVALNQDQVPAAGGPTPED
jgi:hypothetical protein